LFGGNPDPPADDLMALTKKQRQILDYVESFVDTNGYSPSYEEIAEHFGYNSLATVHEHLTNLETKGFLRKNYNKSRSLEIVRADLHAPALELPLMGRWRRVCPSRRWRTARRPSPSRTTWCAAATTTCCGSRATP
jgi:SOS-response transcriptional repressor LexA